MTARVRSASEADVKHIHAIECASFGDPWSLQTFHHSLTLAHVRLSVLEDARGVAGYAVLWMSKEECELANIAVDPVRRGAGVGARLLDAAIDAARGEGALVMFLEVRASNEAARRLYASRGFHEVGRRAAYYQNPVEDALILRRDLL